MGTISQPLPSNNMETKLIILAFISMASAFPYPYPQAPGPALSYPKAGPNGHYDAKHYFQYTNVAAPDVFEWGYRRGNDPQHFREEYLSQKAHNFKAKLRWGDLMGVKVNNFTTTTMVDMPPKHPNTLHPSKCQATPLDDRSTNILAFFFLKAVCTLYIVLPMQYLRTIISNKFSNP